MKPFFAQPPDAGEAGRGGWGWALLALAVGLLALSSQSLWIDEALTAVKAGQPTFAGWWRALQASRDSDLQMPVYMFYIWGFARFFGTGEWALRAANLPWFVAGVTAFAAAFPRPFQYRAAVAVLVSPFAWYYLDEARPYAMQLGASLLLFAALVRLHQATRLNEPMVGAEKSWLRLFLLSLILLSGSSLLGMIWAVAPLIALFLVVPLPRLRAAARSHGPALAACFCCLAVLAGYYLWALERGARASATAGTNAASLFDIPYELSGFAGLGPGRLAGRAGLWSVFRPFAPLLGVYGVLLLGVLGLGAASLRRTLPGRIFVGTLVALLLPSLVLLAAGIGLHFRILARHFTPLFPVVMVLLAAGLTAACGTRRNAVRAVAWTFLILAFVSCLSLRFAARHAKDDYRAAAAAANAALQAGHRVWWNASLEGAAYYHVPLSGDPATAGAALAVLNPPTGFADRLPPPEVIVASKPDVYDSGRSLAGFLARGGWSRRAELPAFTIWQNVENK